MLSRSGTSRGDGSHEQLVTRGFVVGGILRVASVQARVRARASRRALRRLYGIVVVERSSLLRSLACEDAQGLGAGLSAGERGDERAAMKHPERRGLSAHPALVGRERLCGDDRDAIPRRGDGAEVYGDVIVPQRGRAEGSFSHDVPQPRVAAREEILAVAEQKVERALLGELAGERRDELGEAPSVLGSPAVARGELLEQPAECVLGVRSTDGREASREGEALGGGERSVVSEDPVSPPQLSRERVRVGEAHAASCLAANVRDRLKRLDRVLSQKLRQRTARARVGIEKDPRRRSVEERQAPAVCVRSGRAASTGQPRKRKHDVRRGVAVHPQ
jgi:hypothetical protein